MAKLTEWLKAMWREQFCVHTVYTLETGVHECVRYHSHGGPHRCTCGHEWENEHVSKAVRTS